MKRTRRLTLEFMETNAMQNADGLYGRKLGEKYLDVTYDPKSETYKYEFDRKPITRSDALHLLRTE